MSPLRHYDHLQIRLGPDWQRALVALLWCAFVTTPLAMSSLSITLKAGVIVFLVVPGVSRILVALQLNGRDSVASILLRGNGGWWLHDARGRAQPATLINIVSLSIEHIELQFRDRDWNFRTVEISAANSNDIDRYRLAVRLAHDFRQPLSPIVHSVRT